MNLDTAEAREAFLEEKLKLFGSVEELKARQSLAIAAIIISIAKEIYGDNWEELVEEKLNNSKNLPSNASGTLSFRGGHSLINENGLESIITPQGTITSLPAKSGIVPADLTRNLWTLGEVAPNLIARLTGSNLQTTANSTTNDNSIKVQNLNATFNTKNDFDGRQFWSDVRSQIVLSKN